MSSVLNSAGPIDPESPSADKLQFIRFCICLGKQTMCRKIHFSTPLLCG